jgi:hypothetical protein
VTEKEWFECTDPTPMLNWLRGKVTARKSRLFALVCCRRMWHLLSDRRSRSAVERAEVLADKQTATPSEWHPLRLDAWSAEYELHGGTDLQRDLAATVVKEAVTYQDSSEGLRIRAASTSHRTASTMSMGACFGSIFTAERAAHGGLIRCMFGNSFRPITIDVKWLTPAVTSVALTTYDERTMPSGELDSARLALLADALEEAGCTDADVLGHCRSDGPHARGCWVVDLILGKQ